MKKTQRRDRGSGTVRQRKDGRWEGRVCHGTVRSPVNVYGKTKQDVIEKIRTELAKPRADHEDQRLTVEGWFTKWLGLIENDPSFARTTHELYNHKATAYIIPHVGNLRLTKLKVKHIYEMLDALAENKTGARTVQVAFQVLRRGLEVARRRGLIASNPAMDVDKPKHVARGRVYLRSLDEIKAFLAAAQLSDMKALFVLGLDTGCRVGELLALQWADVDEKSGLLHITATLKRDQDGNLHRTKPKTATSVRTVTLPLSSIEALREHHKTSLASGEAAEWVFHDKKGRPLWRDGYVRSEVQRIATTLKKPGLCFHSLRHSSVSLLMRQGVDLRTIQNRIGHSTPRLTLSLYSHAMLTPQDAAVAALDEVHRKVREPDTSVSGQISGQTDNPPAAQAN